MDPDRVIVGGFSSGGFASLVTAFHQTLAARGFVALCPEVPVTVTDADITAAVKRGLRGSLLTTELDHRVEAQRAVAERWKKLGLDGEFVGHAEHRALVPQGLRPAAGSGDRAHPRPAPSSRARLDANGQRHDQQPHRPLGHLAERHLRGGTEGHDPALRRPDVVADARRRRAASPLDLGLVEPRRLRRRRQGRHPPLRRAGLDAHGERHDEEPDLRMGHVEPGRVRRRVRRHGAALRRRPVDADGDRDDRGSLLHLGHGAELGGGGRRHSDATAGQGARPALRRQDLVADDDSGLTLPGRRLGLVDGRRVRGGRQPGDPALRWKDLEGDAGKRPGRARQTQPADPGLGHRAGRRLCGRVRRRPAALRRPVVVARAVGHDGEHGCLRRRPRDVFIVGGGGTILRYAAK